MRKALAVTSFAAVTLLAVSGPAQAQGLRLGTPPSVSVEVKPGTTYTYSLEYLGVVGGGAVAGFVVGQMLFMGHFGPVLTGVAGGYLANLWYSNQ